MPQILIVVLPPGPDVRTQVRYIVDVELGVRVQCVVSAELQLPHYIYSDTKTAAAPRQDYQEPFIFSIPHKCCLEV